MTISPDLMEQVEQCLQNIATALQAAGSSVDDIVKVRYILPNKFDFEPCWPVFKKYLAIAKPAATMIVAGLLDDAMKLEVEVTARLISELERTLEGTNRIDQNLELLSTF